MQWIVLDHWHAIEDYAAALAFLDDLSADPLGRWDHDRLAYEGYFPKLVDLRIKIGDGLQGTRLAAQNP